MTIDRERLAVLSSEPHFYRGLNVLTDPVLSDRASPFRLVGPKRFTPPALTVGEMQLTPTPRCGVARSWKSTDFGAISAVIPVMGRFFREIGELFAPIDLALERQGFRESDFRIMQHGEMWSPR